MMFFFSVVIPVFKDVHRLMDCLNALTMQDLPKDEFEVIVVNNDPNERVRIDSFLFSRLHLTIVGESTPGSYAARNKGISIAKGAVLALTDSDCIPDRGWLNNAKTYFINDIEKEIGILTGDVPLFFKDPARLSRAEIYEKYTGFTFEAYAKEGNCGAGNWFSYPEVMREFGGFNPLLKSNGDTELSGKISKKCKILFAPDVVVRHPARYYVKDIVFKYRRLIGGTYSRRYFGRPIGFFWYIVVFTFRRFRFSLKKIFTVPPKESWAIIVVCMAISCGAWKEYFHLISGGDAKR